MDYLQYKNVDNTIGNVVVVLNLIINGLPSIPSNIKDFTDMQLVF